MNYLKKPLQFKTSNNNNYLLSYNKNQIIYLHPIVSLLINKYIETKDLEKCKEVVSNQTDLSNDFKYYYSKFQFLLEEGFLDAQIKSTAPITEDVIKDSVSDVKHIVFEVTENCNLRCKYCIFGNLYIEKQSKEQNKDLNIDLAKKIIDYVLSQVLTHPLPLFSISFFGGEPLLRFSFIEEVVHYVKEKWPNQIFRFGMTTNAVLIDKYMDFLVQNDFFILLSLDGNENDNIYRTYKNKKPSFKKVFENSVALKNKYPSYFENNVQFNAVVHSKSNTADIKDFFLRKFHKEPQFTQELSFHGLNKKTIKEYESLLNTYTKNAKQTPYYFKRKFIDTYPDFDKLIRQDNINKNQYFLNDTNATCLPFQVKLFISATGGAQNCEKIGASSILHKFTDENIDFNYKTITEIFKRIQINANKKCKDCFIHNCTECTLAYFNNKEEFNCTQFISKNRALDYFAEQLSCIEENPEALNIEPPVK